MLTILLYIIICGVVLYLVETYIPMSYPFKLVFRVVVVIWAILLLLQAVGISNPVPRLTL